MDNYILLCYYMVNVHKFKKQIIASKKIKKMHQSSFDMDSCSSNSDLSVSDADEFVFFPENDSTPLYLDRDRKVYDKYYLPVQSIPKTQSDDTTSCIQTLEHNEFLFNIENSRLPYFPEPSHFKTKEDFYACITWKKCIEDLFFSVVLPFLPVDHIYLQRWTQLPKVPYLKFGKFKPPIDPLLPQNLTELRMCLLKGDVNPDQQFPYQIQHREIVQHKHQFSQNQQWQGQLILSEPIPLFYNSFEEFDEAYENWSELVKNDTEIPIDHPYKMGDIARIDLAPSSILFFSKYNSLYNSLYNSYIDHNNRSLNNENENTVSMELDWVPYDAPYAFEKIFPRFKPKIELQWEEINCDVIGVDKIEFVTDFMNYGVHFRTIDSHKPLHPKRVITYTSPKNCRKELIILVQDKNITKSARYLILNLPFESEDLHSLWSEPFNKIFEPLLEVSEFEKLYNYARCCNDFEIRYYHIMKEFVNSSFAPQFYEFIHKIENLKTLFLFSQAITRNYNLIPPPKMNDPLIISIAQFYYFTLIIESHSCGFWINQKLIENCKHLSRALTNELFSHSIIKEKLWTSILLDTPNDYTQAITMLVLSPSILTHKAIFIPEFFKYSTQSSKYIVGKVFLLNLFFNDYGLIGELIANTTHPLLSQLIKGIDPYYAHLIRGFFFNFIDRYTKSHLTFNPDSLLSFFIEASTINFKEFTIFLEPLSYLITSKDLVETFSRESYHKQISGLAAMVFFAVSETETASGLKISLSFLKLENCVAEAAKCTHYIDLLANSLDSCNYCQRNIAWKCVISIIKFPPSFKKIMNETTLSEAIKRLSKTEDPDLAKKLLRFFCIGLTSSHPDAVQTTCLLMLNAIGLISCLVSTSHMKFIRTPKTVRAVDKLMKILKKLKNSSAQYFVDSMINHINSSNDGMILLKRFNLI
ncbi:hypothetical protein TRFO_04624 [Tritrichomonas foetus]|uniref:Uncharacterized protein n=1 Tax=Tritrichomonas foetus TaxID=1144522 RepID=A0A1J4KDJ9_9EUKA|nr:hypothetical protein TRFO_04624 [Tritrichomonas foetus]|eukprot:OHT09058.1 hypothetical protein TRFO_04624 [Tritrichomonas foetus]